MPLEPEPERIEGVRQRLLLACPDNEISSRLIEDFGPVEFLIGKSQRVQIDRERFADWHIAEEILPDAVLAYVSSGKSIRFNLAGEVSFLD